MSSPIVWIMAGSNFPKDLNTSPYRFRAGAASVGDTTVDDLIPPVLDSPQQNMEIIRSRSARAARGFQPDPGRQDRRPPAPQSEWSSSRAS